MTDHTEEIARIKARIDEISGYLRRPARLKEEERMVLNMERKELRAKVLILESEQSSEAGK